MDSVFLLEHLHFRNGDEEDAKTLGVYSSRALAVEAVERFRLPPGFRDTPEMADPSKPDMAEGFYIDEYEVNQNNWSEGVGTARVLFVWVRSTCTLGPVVTGRR